MEHFSDYQTRLVVRTGIKLMRVSQKGRKDDYFENFLRILNLCFVEYWKHEQYISKVPCAQSIPQILRQVVNKGSLILHLLNQ